jgi:hypothetical protein
MSRSPRRFQAIVVTEALKDDLDGRQKEGRVRRRLVATTGQCPCGARLRLPEMVPGSEHTITVVHEPNCPAVENLG